MNGEVRIILYANLIPFLAGVFFIVLIRINPIFDKRQSKLFWIIAFLNLAMIIAVSLNYKYARSDVDYAWEIRRCTSFLNFAISPAVPLMLYQIFAHKKSKGWLYVPIIINGVLCFVSIFNGIIFNIEKNNWYERGPLFIIPFLTTVGYLLLIIFKPNKSHLTNKRVERIFLLSIIGTLMLAMGLEIFYTFSFLTWDVSCMGTIMYYQLLNIYQSIEDPLTGAYNRQTYLKALERLENKKTGIVALLDINNFKEVNDNFGHDAGDQYLIQFVETINKSFFGVATLYRIGGDEFILIAKKAGIAKFEDTLAKARTEALKQQMIFACGYQAYEAGVSIEDMLKSVDKMMYANKRKIKETENAVK